jgi:hypothetical protein
MDERAREWSEYIRKVAWLWEEWHISCITNHSIPSLDCRAVCQAPFDPAYATRRIDRKNKLSSWYHRTGVFSLMIDSVFHLRLEQLVIRYQLLLLSQ